MIKLLTLLSCSHIIIHCIFCISRMKHETKYTIWAYHAFLSSGCLLILLNILINNHKPTMGTMLIVIGISMKYLFDRRGCNNHQVEHHEHA